MVLKVGDRVVAIAPCDEYDSLIGKKGTVIWVSEGPTPIAVKFDEEFLGGHTCGNRIKKGHGRWCEISSLKKITSSSLMDSLVKKFALATKSEPDKTFIKAGVMEMDGSLTNEGTALFLAYLLQEHGADFKTKVVDPIVEEEKADME